MLDDYFEYCISVVKKSNCRDVIAQIGQSGVAVRVT